MLTGVYIKQHNLASQQVKVLNEIKNKRRANHLTLITVWELTGATEAVGKCRSVRFSNIFKYVAGYVNLHIFRKP